jgi:hypothetical protein
VELEGGTARVWAFRVEERIADIAVAKDAGSLLALLACFFRSTLVLVERGSYSLT